MTENEAQKWLEKFEWDDSEETSEALGTICEALQEYPKFRAIGTMEEFKALKEKSVAKKVIVKGQGHEADCYCPNCNTFLGNDQDWSYDQTKCCSECGQALADY